MTVSTKPLASARLSLLENRWQVEVDGWRTVTVDQLSDVEPAVKALVGIASTTVGTIELTFVNGRSPISRTGDADRLHQFDHLSGDYSVLITKDFQSPLNTVALHHVQQHRGRSPHVTTVEMTRPTLQWLTESLLDASAYQNLTTALTGLADPPPLGAKPLLSVVPGASPDSDS